MEFQRNLEFSSAYFSGFNLSIDIRYFETIDEIINHGKNNLLSVLQKYNFIILIEYFNKCNFHIHTHSLEEILLSNDTIYICDHCDEYND
jgi:hypothetical protein